MSYQHLWAAWREAYVASVPDTVQGERGPTPSEDCVFCRLIGEGHDEEHLIVRREPEVVAILNAYPYASGHLLVMPIRHVGELDALSHSESVAMWELARTSVSAINRAYGPDGVNLGANLGRAAGAGIPEHLHLHVVPRWVGDTNFMTTVAAVRVMPEALSDSYEKLKKAWGS